MTAAVQLELTPETTCEPWCAEDTGHDGPCRSRSRMTRAATLRLMRVCGPKVEWGSVAQWDQRTSGNDARAALSLSLGAHPDDLDPVGGQWDGVKRAPACDLTACVTCTGCAHGRSVRCPTTGQTRS